MTKLLYILLFFCLAFVFILLLSDFGIIFSINNHSIATRLHIAAFFLLISCFILIFKRKK